MLSRGQESLLNTGVRLLGPPLASSFVLLLSEVFFLGFIFLNTLLPSQLRYATEILMGLALFPRCPIYCAWRDRRVLVFLQSLRAPRDVK